ncbi:MAG: hypothetical protein IKE64_12485 [Thermoguttaceae bacterium]|nr:hypothetical protein [Thermoguttaceae bacterium]
MAQRKKRNEPHRGERLPEIGRGDSGRRASRPDYIRHDLRCTELSQREIARKYSVDTRTVYFHAQLIIRPNDKPEKVFRMRERKITEHERTTIERLVKTGSTYLAAAFEVQVSIRTVLKVIYGDDYFQKWEEESDE